MRKAILLSMAIMVLSVVVVFCCITLHNLLNGGKDCTVYYSKDSIGVTAAPPGCLKKDIRYVSR